MEEKVEILSPKGVLGEIDPSEVDNALAQGFKMPNEGDLAKSHNEKLSDGIVGKTAAFAGSALNSLTFGATEAALEAYAPSAARALKTAQDVNPATSMAGTATGLGIGLTAGAPILGGVTRSGQAVGGAVEGAMTAGKLATVAGRTAQFATEGVILTSPVAAIKTSIEDYDAAAETLLMGGGLGAGLGVGAGYLPILLKGAGSQVGKVSGAVTGKINPVTNYLAESSEALQKDQGGKILGITKAIRGSNKMGNSRADELIEFADKKGLLSGWDSPEKITETVKTLKEKAGEEIGKIVKAIDGTGKKFVDTDKLMNNLRTKLDIPEGELLSAERNTYQKAMTDVSSKLLDKKGEAKLVNLSVLQDLRKKLGDYAFRDFGQVRPARDIVADMRSLIDDSMRESIESAEKTIPDQAKKWKAAKVDYRNYTDLVKPLENKVASEYGNQFVRPSDFGGAILGGATGGIPGAIVGYAANTLRQRFGAQLAYKTIATINRGVENRNNAIAQAVGSFLSSSSKLPSRLRVSEETLAPTSLGILDRFVNDKQVSRAKNLEKFTEEISSELANPVRLQERLSTMTNGMAGLDPELGAGVYDKLIATTKYLQEKAPKGMNIPTALSPARFAPSDRDISSFERRVRAAVNPYSLLLDLNKGILSPEALETVKDLYPSFFEQVSKTMIEQGAEAKNTVSYAKRLQISALLGTQLDGLSVKPNQQALQQNYATENTEQQAAAKANPNSKIAANFQTDIQRISNK